MSRTVLNRSVKLTVKSPFASAYYHEACLSRVVEFQEQSKAKKEHSNLIHRFSMCLFVDQPYIDNISIRKQVYHNKIHLPLLWSPRLACWMEYPLSYLQPDSDDSQILP